jgi:hypothetical protein
MKEQRRELRLRFVSDVAGGNYQLSGLLCERRFWRCAGLLMAQAEIYDPRFHTFESWASLMVELYAEQQLEIPTAATDWKQWG